MWNEKMKAGIFGAMVLSLAACGTPSNQASSTSMPVTSTTSAATGYGTVQSIEVVPKQTAGVGLGTAAGAVIGGVLGNQVGSGTGRTAATVAGAAGGALAGHSMERGTAGSSQSYRITLRMDNGAVQSLVQDSAPNLQVGDRVRIDNGMVVERMMR